MAAVRLDRLKQEFPLGITISWKAYPLVVETVLGRRFDSHRAQAWARASKEEPSLVFRPWPKSEDLPSSSFPALEAAKCAELQNPEAFDRYHMAIFQAFFEECRDISDREVLGSLAVTVGLDVPRLTGDLDQGVGQTLVLADYKEAMQTGGIGGVPTAIFAGELRLEGAVPLEMYRRAVEVVSRRLRRS